MAQEEPKLGKEEEYLNGWKRERADFLNYKKDEMERIGQLVKYANEEIILNILPILDNLCLAASHIKDPGVEQIKKQLEDFLKKEGIEHIEAIGKEFDPNFHEVIEEIGPDEPLAKKGKPCTIVEEVQRGYTLHGKLIRVAKVKVTK
ncbi:MAG: nucleotide exchange factor GrpE [Candidatus Staskawiczbacteria bacterium]|nr:nucleotide exchange factor GrpE [Candidatus Staskawiczbacteria bacterium]